MVPAFQGKVGCKTKRVIQQRSSGPMGVEALLLGEQRQYCTNNVPTDTIKCHGPPWRISTLWRQKCILLPARGTST